MGFLRLATQTLFTVGTFKLASDVYDAGKKKVKERLDKNKNEKQDDNDDKAVASVTD
jgi:hypothetical protein